jgi:hypothetical protein
VHMSLGVSTYGCTVFVIIEYLENQYAPRCDCDDVIVVV